VTAAITTDDPEIVAAITDQRLAAWSDDSRSEFAAGAASTCATIGGQVTDDVCDVVAWLAARGHAVVVETRREPRQRHDIHADVASFEEADSAATALGECGFERWERWSGAAARSFRAHGEQITVARTDAHSFVLRLRWNTPPSGGRARRLLRSVFRPTAGDWTLVRLPTPLWRGYSLVRPVRLVLERIGRHDPHAAGLGPFLSTPESLIDPLFALAELGPDDTLVDIGCGDGRLAIAAALATGCNAIGVEHDPRLVDRARAAASAEGVADLVTIRHGDARDVDLSHVTVAFMFLPMDVMADLVADTLEQLPVGARLIAHEQTPLPPSMSPRPASSHAVIANDAVTVAHVWRR
jgi:precorrin-6B methylase 2